MFTALHFKEMMNQKPFKPFRVHMTEGKSFEVQNHDSAFVLRHALEIGLDPDSDSISERTVRCAFIHITRVEEMTEQAA